jgi:hypothetical protein
MTFSLFGNDKRSLSGVRNCIPVVVVPVLTALVCAVVAADYFGNRVGNAALTIDPPQIDLGQIRQLSEW